MDFQENKMSRERFENKPKIKKINILLEVNENTNPVKLTENLQKIIKELETKGIVSSIKRGPITIDVNGKAED